MDLSDAAGFVGRDWRAVAALKEAFWIERLRRLGPVEGLRIVDELRKQILASRPGWPSPEERRQDREDHERLAELLHRATLPRSR